MKSFNPRDKVRFTGHGIPPLDTGSIYTVDRCLAAAFQCIVYLREVPGSTFDGVNFVLVQSHVEVPAIFVPDNEEEIRVGRELLAILKEYRPNADPVETLKGLIRVSCKCSLWLCICDDGSDADERDGADS